MCNKIGAGVANYYIGFLLFWLKNSPAGKKKLQSFLCGIFIGFCIGL
jgi:hypothetical protein